MTQRPLVILTDVSDIDPRPAVDLLDRNGFDVEVLKLDVDPAVPPAATRAVAAIGGYAHLGEDFFAALPDLELVALTSAGADMVDAEAAERHGVRIRPLYGAATEEVAVHALALVLAVERGLRVTEQVAAGSWSEAFEHLPRRLSGCTLGVLGLGRIGAEFARIGRPMFGRVIGYDPYAPVPEGVEGAGLDELLAAADVLSVHMPLSEQTRGMLGATELARLPHGASLINVSRAEIVDQGALLAALDTGRLRGAGLDVLTGEPPAAGDPLRAHPRTVVTPHVGYLSEGSLRAYEQQPAATVVEWWRSRQP
ncbi:D-3-phosphoglycerate dehydrogenase [Actinoplanes lutulentus]|uniref:D-3-phosphoglycerate dehydrogenase n=1 Tax=Actinoplanes lutulentus TaxID=1287878 RepID=A0A327YYH9_9ACTN|nr:NAD(P)-dependent oxidoreductase [Actinoplanes lutulentus]MBB2946571.1 D-3-phosphoglycerate dehydrogenase [Actinoplanes lutulentus]RAK26489.1 D-3-phosphoglycerate dehydrogenase [Actinoplanes lutulentus]